MIVHAFIQARMASQRLPGKVLLPLGGAPMLEHVVRRVRACRLVRHVMVLTGMDKTNDPIRAFCDPLRSAPCYSGSDADVLDRFYEAALFYGAEHILRVTADCPLVDPDLLTELVKHYASDRGHWDQRREQGDGFWSVSTGTPNNDASGPRYPDGLDAEIISFANLAWTWREAHGPYDREHVTAKYVRNLGPRRNLLRPETDFGTVRLTVDDAADYQRMADLFARHHGDDLFNWRDTL